ncbi:UDP-glucosyltransferase 29-like isoform X2 [Andrographis paniculata]|uniref:UDP-glucosyltransferase 29-like isoform X2 n=1 Tax=Andrographis paniculata TaxID=175694 RepID=UPI0021E8CD04|nr:UDP-glucosyltransferase 29-like isoform X2 [Andrographis paniculata]
MESSSSSSQKSSSLRILMFPWLAHGHIFPYLELSKRLLNYKIRNSSSFDIHLCSTPINFTSINHFLQAHNLQNSINLIELHLQQQQQQSADNSIDQLIPPHYHTTKNLPPNLILPLIKAFQTAKTSFSHILDTLNPNLPWAATTASSKGIPAVHFSVVGAATRSYLHHRYSRHDDNFPFPELCLDNFERQTLDHAVEFLRKNVFGHDQDVYFLNYKLSTEFALLKTTEAFEGKYLTYASSALDKKLLPVGPLVTPPKYDVIENSKNSDIIRWLSKKEEHSTVYISFGSEHRLSKQEIEEIAKGLLVCEANFIWVLRLLPPLMEDDEKQETLIEELSLPEGFLDRVSDRGLVVTDWAPQAEVLGHSSIGAFLSHCGWSSVMESLYFGVPIVGMPMAINMFVDARMMVDNGVCLRVNYVSGSRKEEEDDDDDDDDDVNGIIWYRGEDIGEAIGEAIVGKLGEKMRKRVAELRLKMQMEEEEAIAVVANHLCQICTRN